MMKAVLHAWLTQHHHALLDTLRRLRRQPVAYLFNILVVAIALALPLMGYTLLDNLRPLTHELATDPEISVFMQRGATPAEATAVQQALLGNEVVAEVKFVARDAAMEEMKQQPTLRDILAVLPGNPLPDAFIVHIKPVGGADPQLSTLTTLATQFRSLPKVDHVQIDSDWIKRLEALLRFLKIAVVILAATLGAAIIAVIFNTIRLQVLTQRDEIEISKLFGATNHFIRRPFVYMGAAQGLLGGVLALIIVGLALMPLNESLGEFTRLYMAEFHFHALPLLDILACLGIATLLGWLGSIFSVNRHLAKLG